MPSYITTMRVKLDARRRVMAGEVLELSTKAAAPLLAAGAIEPHKVEKTPAAPAPAPAPEPASAPATDPIDTAVSAGVGSGA
jgi:hypothetical protein